MVRLTSELDTSLKLLPLSLDAVLEQVRSVAPPWALLALSKERERYNEFDKAFKHWEAERPFGQAQFDKSSAKSLHALTQGTQSELIEMVRALLDSGRETADLEAGAVEAEINDSVLCELVQGDAAPLLNILALRDGQVTRCFRCNLIYERPKEKGERPKGHLLNDCPMKPLPEELAKRPRETWSSNPANKIQAPHTHFKPSAPNYFERPGGNRGVHVLSVPDSAAGSLETVASHVATERDWYDQTLRASEARTLRMLEDYVTKAPVLT